MISLKSLKIPL